MIRVNWVANKKASTCRWPFATEWMKCSSNRVYRSMEPLTSHIKIRGRGLSLRSRRANSNSSPPYLRFCLRVRRRSIQEPSPGAVRRVRRFPRSQDRSDIIRLASAISKPLKSEKSFCRSTSLAL